MDSSRRAGHNKEEARRRLTESLRANLVRRKIQKRERAAQLAATQSAGAVPDEDHVPRGALFLKAKNHFKRSERGIHWIAFASLAARG